MDPLEHRSIAVQTYNRAQDLWYATRTAEEDLEMLTAVFTSRHHWALVGGPTQKATSDWAVGRVLSVLGAGELALRFALRAAEQVNADFPAWRKASALEGVARAYAACGDIDRAREYVTRAKAELSHELDAEEVAIIGAQIDDVPLDSGF